MTPKIIEPLLRFNPKNISQSHQKVKHQNFILITRNHDNIQWRTQNIPIKMSLLEEDQEKDKDDNLRGWRKRKVSMQEDLKGFDMNMILFWPIYNQELSQILFSSGNNEVISDKRLQHQLKFTNGSPDVVNEMFKEIRSATASPSDSNRSQLPNKVSNETAHPKQR